MWPNEFAQLLISLTGVTSDQGVGMVTVFALVVYMVLVPSVLTGMVALAAMKIKGGGYEAD